MLPFNESMINPESVKALWQMMAKEYGTTVIDKSDSELMAIVGTFLDSLGILDKEKFLHSYTTTIGSRIYRPFTPGVDEGLYGLWAQVVVCTHEHLHKVQSDVEGFLVFSAKYLGSDDCRAIEYEAPAYRATMELEVWRSGGKVDAGYPRFLAAKLRNYNCGEEAINAAEEALNIAREDIEAGNIITVTAIKTIQFLSAMG